MHLATLSEFAGSFSGSDVISAYEQYVAAFSRCNWEFGCVSCAGIHGRKFDLSGFHSGWLGRTGVLGECGDRIGLDVGAGDFGRCFGGVSGDKLPSRVHEIRDSVAAVSEVGHVDSVKGQDTAGFRCSSESSDTLVNERSANVGVTDAGADSAADVQGVNVGKNLLPRGPNYARNKANRDAKRDRKRAQRELRAAERVSFFSTCDESVRKNLADSRAQRLMAENEAATVRARADAEVQRARDVATEVKRKQISVRANIERDMVSIEKTHAVLTATGNVPGDMTGFAATIIGSGSISPDSSASMAEFRACQKKLLDTEAKLDQVYESLGLDSLAKQREFFKANDLYTDNTENRNMFDEQGLDYVQDPFNEGKIYTF